MLKEIQFGKHRGKTLPQIVLSDPDWFFWAYEHKAFQGELKVEADEIFRKATSIKIPQVDGEEREVEYLIHADSKKLSGVDAVPKSRPLHSGSSQAFRKPVFDLSVPRQISKFDKLGGKMMVKALKIHIFRDPRTKLTKRVCEKFFNDETNFK